MKRREFAGLLGSAVVGAAFTGSLPGIRQGHPDGRAVRLPPELLVNGDRLNASLDALGRIGRGEDGGIWRVGYSDADMEARRYTMELMRAAGLDVSIDATGNILGARPGTVPDLPPILFGSHIDSVPRGGNYDGPVGSLSAIEVARTLHDAGHDTRHPLLVTIWADEEGGLTGSRGYVDGLTREELEETGPDGRTLAERIRRVGGRPEKTVGGGKAPGSIRAYLELHIEQGAVLYEAGVDIGVVEGIVGIDWYDVTFTGAANHAGTTPMDRRQNAMLATAELALAVDRIVKAEPGRQVGTVGRVNVTPNAPNVVPGQVVCTVELRDLSTEKLDMLWGRIRAAAQEAAARFDVDVSWRQRIDLTPALSDETVRNVIAESAGSLDLTTLRMPSGAGHDAQTLARLGPMGMLFVPSVDGISHAPEELTRPRDVVNGANVLLRSVLALDAE